MSTTRKPESSDAKAAANAYPKVILLPGGSKAEQLRPLKGRDSATAHRIAGDKSPMEFGTAILAQVITINGQPVVMEDLLEMEMSDLNVITEAVMGEVLSPTRKS